MVARHTLPTLRVPQVAQHGRLPVREAGLFEPKSVLAGGAVGALGYVGYQAVRPDLSLGTPNPQVDPDDLRHGQGEGRWLRAEGGALAWDDRWSQWAQAHPNQARIDGRIYTVGTVPCAFAFYGVADDLMSLSNRYAALLDAGLSPEKAARMRQGFERDGVYDLSQLTRGEKDLVAVFVNCSVQALQALRVLSRYYRAANLGPTTYPSASRQSPLHVIRATGWPNPLHKTVPGYAVQSAGDWESYGVLGMREFMSAYPGLTVDVMSAEGQQELARDVEQTGQHSTKTMGNPLLGLLARIVIVLIVTGGAVVLGRELINAVAGYFGYSREFLLAQVEQYEEAIEACRQGNQEACRQADSLARQIRAFRPSLFGQVWLWVGVAGVGVAGVWAYRRWGKKQKGKTRLFGLLPA